MVAERADFASGPMKKPWATKPFSAHEGRQPVIYSLSFVIRTSESPVLTAKGLGFAPNPRVI